MSYLVGPKTLDQLAEEAASAGITPAALDTLRQVRVTQDGDAYIPAEGSASMADLEDRHLIELMMTGLVNGTGPYPQTRVVITSQGRDVLAGQDELDRREITAEGELWEAVYADQLREGDVVSGDEDALEAIDTGDRDAVNWLLVRQGAGTVARVAVGSGVRIIHFAEVEVGMEPVPAVAGSRCVRRAIGGVR